MDLQPQCPTTSPRTSAWRRRQALLGLCSAPLALLPPVRHAWALPQAALQCVALDLPPLSYQEKGSHRGLFVDLLAELTAASQLSYELRPEPLTRALRATEGRSQQLTFPLFRNPEREDRYLWVGPVIPRRVLLFRLGQRGDLPALNLGPEVRSKIAVKRSTSTQAGLSALGLRVGVQLEPAISYDAAIRMLLARHVDYLAMNELVLGWYQRKMGIPQGLIVATQELESNGHYWYALTPDLSRTAELLGSALQTLRAAGRLDALKRDYGLL